MESASEGESLPEPGVRRIEVGLLTVVDMLLKLGCRGGIGKRGGVFVDIKGGVRRCKEEGRLGKFFFRNLIFEIYSLSSELKIVRFASEFISRLILTILF